MPKRNSPIQQIKKIVVQFFSVLFKTTCFSMNNRLYLRIGSRNTTDNTGYSKYREKRYFPYPHVVRNWVKTIRHQLSHQILLLRLPCKQSHKTTLLHTTIESSQVNICSLV